MRLSKLSSWGRLVSGTALGLAMAIPSIAAPVAPVPSTAAKGLLITVQAKDRDAEAGAEALRKKIREKKQHEKGNAGGDGRGANENAVPGQPPAQAEQTPKAAEPAPQPAEQPPAQARQQVSPPPKAQEAAPTPEPQAQAAPQKENVAPAPAIKKMPVHRQQGEADNAAQGSGRKRQEMQQGQGEAVAPEPKRVTAPKPETSAPARQQTGNARQTAPQTSTPERGGAKKPESVRQGGRQKTAQPEMPTPKIVTVPKKQEAAPAKGGTAETPKAREPEKSSGSAAERLRRDLREKLRSQTQQQPETPAPETATQGGQAPLTDSGKEAVGGKMVAPLKPRREKPGGAETQQTEQTQTAPEQVITPQMLPKSDAAAQEPAISGQKIESIQAESGSAVRTNTRPRRQFDESRVIARSGNRIVIRLDNGRLSVFSTDDHDSRLRRHANNVRVEELRGGLLRETIYLRDGSRIVTIYSRGGDVLRRSRILPDGREILLVYVPRDRWNDLRDPYYDPGRYLPPLILTIPRSDYIFERERATPDDYYRFLRQPPVEPVPRLYSIDEVTRSARIRDMARRVDLVSVHFEFGSAEISESEVDELQALAEAMNRLLDENPGEMFLIEGHTDAVGSEEANLVLSDKRAESVAEVLTDYFGIPPENMVTHGYGERYLKIDTQAPERENRRVAIRRITPLVAPVNEQVLR